MKECIQSFKPLYPHWIGVVVLVSIILRLYFIGSTDLLVEEAYYWNYAQHLDYSYLDHPPMVAVLIKIMTGLLGDSEMGVRMAALVCWFVAMGFSVRLTNLVCPGAGRYALLLLSILPFFFLQSMFMTPDAPLIACWSATLYCLYRALVLEDARYWIGAGIWLGLGLLSKYTIVLLGVTTLVYVVSVPGSRYWFFRKEPYYAAFITLCLFIPVIYWNEAHGWASFAFQGSRRFKSRVTFSLHELFGLFALFIMPPGLWSVWLWLKKPVLTSSLPYWNARRFFLFYTFLPIAWFAGFSLMHAIRFNWIGPAVLGLIPCMALVLSQAIDEKRAALPRAWMVCAWGLLLAYAAMISAITIGTPEWLNRTYLKKFIDWRDLTQQVYQVARQVEYVTGQEPVIVPLDLYNLSSELTYYHHNRLKQGIIPKRYPMVERHVFGVTSLMYQYWTKDVDIHGKTLIVISMDRHDFENPNLQALITEHSPMQLIWTQSQGRGIRMKPYYYQVVTIATKHRLK